QWNTARTPCATGSTSCSGPPSQWRNRTHPRCPGQGTWFPTRRPSPPGHGYDTATRPQRSPARFDPARSHAMTEKQKPPRVPNNASGAYWQLAIHMPYDVAVAASQNGMSPVYLEDYQAMGWSNEPRWGVLDVSLRAEGDDTPADVEVLRTFDTPQEAQEF